MTSFDSNNLEHRYIPVVDNESLRIITYMATDDHGRSIVKTKTDPMPNARMSSCRPIIKSPCHRDMAKQALLENCVVLVDAKKRNCGCPSPYTKKCTPFHILNRESHTSEQSQNEMNFKASSGTILPKRTQNDQKQISNKNSLDGTNVSGRDELKPPGPHLLDIPSLTSPQQINSPSFSLISSPSDPKEHQNSSPSTPVPQNIKQTVRKSRKGISETMITPEQSRHLPCRPPLMPIHAHFMINDHAKHPLRKVNEIHKQFALNVLEKVENDSVNIKRADIGSLAQQAASTRY